MQIFFEHDESNPKNSRYLIRDLGIGFGAFARLDRPLELKDNHLLNMGESFIIVNLINDKPSKLENEQYSLSSGNNLEKSDSHYMKLRLKLFGGPSTGEVFYFRPDDYDPENPEPTTIRIGRSNNCDVVIEDAVLSKMQAHIYFNHEQQCWILMDGAPGGKHSLNGTWLYLNEDFEIYNGLTFKVNQVLFQAHVFSQAEIKEYTA